MVQRQCNTFLSEDLAEALERMLEDQGITRYAYVRALIGSDLLRQGYLRAEVVVRTEDPLEALRASRAKAKE